MLGRNAGHGWCCFGPCLKSGRGVQVRERRGFHLLIYVTPLNPAPSGQPGQSGNVYCWGVEPPSDILARDLEVRARGSPTRYCPGPGPRGRAPTYSSAAQTNPEDLQQYSQDPETSVCSYSFQQIS